MPQTSVLPTAVPATTLVARRNTELGDGTMLMRDVGTVVVERTSEAAVTTGVGDSLFFWVSRPNGRAPILYVVNPSDLTTEEVDDLKAQADEWVRRLGSTLRVI